MKRFWLRVLGYFQTFSQLENGKIIRRIENEECDAKRKKKKTPKWPYAKSGVSHSHTETERKAERICVHRAALFH